MKVTLTTLTSRYGSIDALNANFEALADAIENTLSLDGTSPNALEASLDANSNRIINLPSPSANSDAATKGYVDTITASLENYLDEIETVANNINDVVTAAGIDSNDLATVADNATNIGTVAGISSNVTTVAGISSNVTSVAGNTSNINTVAGNNTNISTVAGISSNVTTVAGISSAVSTVAANITDIQNAEENADAAITAQAAAEAARDAALAALDSFDDRYLGQKTSDPTLDNDGNALAAGALYFNTTTDTMMVYEGSSWVAAYASLSGALLATNNLSDLTSVSSARTNLGLGTAATTAASAYATAAQGSKADTALQSADIGTTVQAYDSDLTTWAGKTAPTGDAVGTTDTQTLSNKTITGTKETVYTITDGADFEIDPANGGIQVVTLGASRSPAVTNFTAGQSVLLGIDDGSTYTITWPTITWATTTATAPTLATSGYTWVVMWKVGSTLYGKY